MAKDQGKVPARGGQDKVDAFLAKVAAAPLPVKTGSRGKLIFAMDATMSREPSWDRAIAIQSEMFDAAADLGGLDIQLAWFRGFEEFHASSWAADARALGREMTMVRCRGGYTQIGKVFAHALQQTKKQTVNALIYVGDCIEEDIDALCAQAGELGLRGLPVFVFHDGGDLATGGAFKEIARLSGGAYCRLDGTSASRLRDLLKAVAIYASGGSRALLQHGKQQGGDVLRLAQQLKKI